jgi:rhodanese-related sulfurtransferase
MTTAAISVEEAYEKIRQGVPVVDVRTPAEFRASHIQSAINLPLDKLTAEQVSQKIQTDSFFVICQAGARGAAACEKLSRQFGSAVKNIDGGMNAWLARTFPVESEGAHCSVMSIERQVRIGAGSLVVLGILLSWFVSGSWIALSLFVGLGLIFSGVTNTCGMAIVLGKMPWNN